MIYQYQDRVQIIGLPDCSEGIGTVIDWYIGIKGQSIKVEFDQICVNSQGVEYNNYWIRVNDPTLTITKLDPIKNEIYI